MNDSNGRPYLKLAEAKQGMIVELDSGFTCRNAGKAMLYANETGGLYFLCDEGTHHVKGQADDGIHCIGIYPIQDADYC